MNKNVKRDINSMKKKKFSRKVDFPAQLLRTYFILYRLS